MFSFLLHGWRSWKSAKGVALLAIVALSVGIGSATAIYSVVHAVLLAPLPYSDQDRFHVVWGAYTARPGWRTSWSYLDQAEFAARSRTLDAWGCFSSSSFNVVFNRQVTRVQGIQVSPVLLSSPGVHPTIGRWFGVNDPGAPYQVVISTALWKRIGQNASILGQPLKINGRFYSVVGVAPPWFRLPPDAPDNDVWVPLNPDEDQRTKRGYRYLICLAKTKPAVSTAQAKADLLRIALQLRKEHPEEYMVDSLAVTSLLDAMVDDIRPTLLLILASAFALLLITCANVAGLLLARSVARARETAVRVALGAGRWQLALQYFTEGLLVSVTGAAAGAVVSFVLVRFVLTLAATDIPRADQIGVNPSVLFFALGLAIFCGVLFSLAPLWQAARTPPNEVLSDGTRASASARSRGLLRAFVIAEIALAFGLLAIGGLLSQQLDSLRAVRPGFDPDHLLTANVLAPITKFPTDAERSRYQTRLVEAISRVPGVESAGFTQRLPLSGWGENSSIEVEGRPPVPADKVESIEQRFISPGYFRAMKIPLIAGRFLTDRDVKNELPGTMAIVVNQTLAHLFWPNGNGVGAFIRTSAWEKGRFQVVGIVGDVRNAGLRNGVRPEMYFTYLENPMIRTAWVVRSKLDESTLARELQKAVLAVDPEQPLFDIKPFRQIAEENISRERLQSFMVSFFALAALLLSILGIYGVVSYAVRQRTTEIGTRMAIGATSRDLIRLVVGDGLKMTAIGVAFGLVFLLILTRLLSQSNLHIQLEDPRPVLAAIAIVTFLAMLACFFPAWRATLVSPMIAIRNEPGSLWQSTRWGILRISEQFSGLVSRVDEQAAASEAALLAEIAEVGRRASSFPEAMQAALGCLRSRVNAESLALFSQKSAGQPYRCSGVVPDRCSDDWILPADALIVSRLRHYAGPIPVGKAEIEATENWILENSLDRLPEIATLRDVGASLVVRVAVKSEVSGLLFVGRPVNRSAYTALEKRLLRGVSAQLALMIENSRLTDRIVEQERLRRELLLASEVQKRLFPENSSTASLQLVGVCVPARGIGGDYYDFLDLGDRRMGIALADVAGKGIAAALIMSVVQASLRSLAGTDGVSLSELASKMNRLLHRSTGSNSYATFFYAQYDDDKKQLRYVNAGHNPPYLLRANVDIEELPAGGTIIGMFAQTSYDEAVLDLKSGDILIAFTDGVTEALDPREEEFGEDRLKDTLRQFAHLPIDDMAARILDKLKSWISDAAQYDDLTFILMKVA